MRNNSQKNIFCDKIIKMKEKPEAAFTLMEIMMVMAIVALIVSIAIIESVQFRKQANESNCMSNLQAIATGFEIYAARHAGSYAPQEEHDLRYLVDEGYLYQDLTMGQIGNFRYVIGSINLGGYDIRGLAVSPVLADHNYQIVTDGILKRSDTPVSSDMDFKSF
jgi:prepilin-type N-terminal cleavage/methylation domain-containing protein